MSTAKHAVTIVQKNSIRGSQIFSFGNETICQITDQIIYVWLCREILDQFQIYPEQITYPQIVNKL